MTVWTPEKIEAAKKKRAATLAAKKKAPPPTPETKAPIVIPVAQEQTPVAHYDVSIPWDKLELTEAERWFGKLRAELDRAGRILNQRHSEPQYYPCKICGKMIADGEEKYRDNSYINKSGLPEPARCCGAICAEKWMSRRIEERRKKAERERTG